MCGNDDGGGRGSDVDRWSDDDDDGVVGDEGVVVMMYGGGCRRRVTGIIGRKRGGAGKEEEGGRMKGTGTTAGNRLTNPGLPEVTTQKIRITQMVPEVDPDYKCKKQTVVANLTTEAEYIDASHCCGQVLWIQNQMMDYGFNFMQTKIHVDNKSVICVVKNLVYHSKTKHIEIRHHFIRESYEKRLIKMVKIYTDNTVADLLTKAFDVSRFNFLVASIGKRDQDTKIPQSDGPSIKVGDEAVHKELGDKMERAATTASSFEAEYDSEFYGQAQYGGIHSKVRGFVRAFYEIIDFLTSSHIYYALTECPTLYISLIEQFWQTAALSTTEDVVYSITATIDGRDKIITEASIRRRLKLQDSEGLSSLPNAEISKQLARMGTAWDQFSSNIATAIICLATNWIFSVSRFIFDAMVKNLDSTHKFLMYPRIEALEKDLQQTKKTYSTALTKLVLKVKKLDKQVRSDKARRRARIVLSEDEDAAEDPSK
ncbi:hypothetical protein Tco_0729201 [Tanacetum coccineum]|uniref:Uncharacterized protein n=1 Tax=Tanacetum coccineum TaxID=301880 RepID=A0ABQ4YNQ7_9ASTR